MVKLQPYCLLMEAGCLKILVQFVVVNVDFFIFGLLEGVVNANCCYFIITGYVTKFYVGSLT